MLPFSSKKLDRNIRPSITQQLVSKKLNDRVGTEQHRCKRRRRHSVFKNPTYSFAEQPFGCKSMSPFFFFHSCIPSDSTCAAVAKPDARFFFFFYFPYPSPIWTSPSLNRHHIHSFFSSLSPRQRIIHKRRRSVVQSRLSPRCFEQKGRLVVWRADNRIAQETRSYSSDAR